MDEKLLFTPRGMAKLRREIDKLTKDLEHLESQTAQVAEVGGNQYHDNASYELLVIDIRGANRRLSDAHCVLNKAVIVEPSKNAETVSIGTKVTIQREGEESETWEIAGFGESDPEQDLLSYNTPIATLIIGRHAGEVVEGYIAGRKTRVHVLKISLAEANHGTK